MLQSQTGLESGLPPMDMCTDSTFLVDMLVVNAVDAVTVVVVVVDMVCAGSHHVHHGLSSSCPSTCFCCTAHPTLSIGPPGAVVNLVDAVVIPSSAEEASPVPPGHNKSLRGLSSHPWREQLMLASKDEIHPSPCHPM